MRPISSIHGSVFEKLRELIKKRSKIIVLFNIDEQGEGVSAFNYWN